ncbi:MAG: Beta-barrel assembly-enhancing protease [Candidatus Marinimicrobia bacterium]|nr:Beta-barrel assembly-enhancing protease [Candidatus Neomarinimicrobiota bacterium]
MVTGTKKFASLLLLGVFATVAFLSIGCQPPQMTPEERKAYEDSIAQVRQDSILKANKAKCEFKLSNGYEYYKQRNWEKAIENYEVVRELGCAPSMAENLYLYLGNAYRETGNQDSAIAVYNEGVEYLPENIYLYQNLAYMYKITNQLQKQVEVQEDLVALDSTNVEYLMDLADLYFSTNQYQKQIDVLRTVLELEPQNSVAQSSLITAMKKAGLDPIDALKKRWENKKNNSTNGVEYGEALFDRGDFEKAITVFKEVTSIDPENIRAWNRLAKAYENVGQPANAIEAYKGILDIDKNRKDIINEITGLYIQMKEFQQAMDWANRTINTGAKNGMGYAARGKVYENLAAECSGGSPDFQDKLVYQMAYEDYQKAVSMGYGQVTARIDYLGNFIPSKGDWFFHEDGGSEIAPTKDCYSWLNRSVKRPTE